MTVEEEAAREEKQRSMCAVEMEAPPSNGGRGLLHLDLDGLQEAGEILLDLDGCRTNAQLRSG